MKNILLRWGIGGWLCLVAAIPAQSSVNVYLTSVPDYEWNYGCMGTASGNLMGYWDRHGFPDFYTGLANGGVAPLTSSGRNTNIISLWASQAGVDGRPTDMPGHVDDYWIAYDNADDDPYLTAGRPEHSPDCIGDFIGLNQKKWTGMAGECSGNVDGFCFVYWDTSGDRRINFTPDATAGEPARDVQSGLRAWTQYRGYDCEVFTQLTDFNPNVPPGSGFTFADLQNEIDHGYPVLLFLQSYTETSRTVGPIPDANPEIHSMLAYGYYLNNGLSYVRFRTSWASGDNETTEWTSAPWGGVGMPIRGVIGYHPLPRIRLYSASGSNLSLKWDGPSADLYNSTSGKTTRVHKYVVEMSPSMSPPNFVPVSSLLTTTTFTVTNCPSPAYFRIQLTPP
ncbi:MAG: hypothetical protein NT154_02170 [Verrucomicrobia bacterium]|nr:hypothetical protein [Verrucomicrobiota bacterium]